MSVIEELNERNYKRILLKVAERYKQILIQTIREMDLDSLVPKKLHFIDSIVIIYRGGSVYVGSPLDYSWNIENGRQAGSRVPIQPLKEWCIYKLGLSEKEAHRVAYAVERKIRSEGIKAKRPFRSSVYRLKAEVEK